MFHTNGFAIDLEGVSFNLIGAEQTIHNNPIGCFTQRSDLYIGFFVGTFKYEHVLDFLHCSCIDQFQRALHTIPLKIVTIQWRVRQQVEVIVLFADPEIEVERSKLIIYFQQFIQVQLDLILLSHFQFICLRDEPKGASVYPNCLPFNGG